MSSGLELERYVDPVIPKATAAMRAMRMRCLFDVILERGYLFTTPLTSSLCGSQKFSSLAEVARCRCDLPVEDEGVRGVEQTEESNAINDQFPDDQVQIFPRRIGTCEYCAHYERGHSDWKQPVSLLKTPYRQTTYLHRIATAQ